MLMHNSRSRIGYVEEFVVPFEEVTNSRNEITERKKINFINNLLNLMLSSLAHLYESWYLRSARQTRNNRNASTCKRIVGV